MKKIISFLVSNTFNWILFIIYMIEFIVTDKVDWGIYALIWLAYILMNELSDIKNKLHEIQEEQNKDKRTFPWW